jgi:hypothetical protein
MVVNGLTHDCGFESHVTGRRYAHGSPLRPCLLDVFRLILVIQKSYDSANCTGASHGIMTYQELKGFRSTHYHASDTTGLRQ